MHIPMQITHVSQRQAPPSKAAAIIHLATATAALAATEANLTACLLKQLLVKIRRLRQQPMTLWPVRPPAATAGKRPHSCVGCGSERHFLQKLSPCKEHTAEQRQPMAKSANQRVRLTPLGPRQGPKLSKVGGPFCQSGKPQKN